MSSTFFGEISEPFTRALTDDDFEYYPDTHSAQLDLRIEEKLQLPVQISTLLFIEIQNGVEGTDYCDLGDAYKPVCKIENAGLDIFSADNDNYIIKWSQTNGITCGEVVQFFEKWICLAKHIYTISLSSIATYQNYELKESPSSIVRILTNDKSSRRFKKLEAPNLVSDFAANVFSFCMHCNIKCTLFVVYNDVLPYDSLNSGPLVDIFNQMNLPPAKFYRTQPIIYSNNLYL